MKISIMLEGQNGLNWQLWKQWVDMVESLGFYGLYRSDHFTNANPPNLDSLELWVSLTYLASHTKRIQFGSLVTPLSFHHPVHLARMAGAVDDLSGGRLKLGLGAGWQEREHQMFGFDLMPLGIRFDRFEEGLQVISGLLRQNEHFSFQGKYYQLNDAELLPKPKREGGPKLLIGGNGIKRTLPLVAKFADEWNALFLPVTAYRQAVEDLHRILNKVNRPIESVRRSMMTNLTYAGTEQKLEKKLNGRTISDMRNRGIIVGTPELVINQLQELAQAGIEEIMLQWLDLTDETGLIHFSENVLPLFRDE